ncbi:MULTISPECIES: dicarboxylate/amino acid:cation symporter [Sphingomonas]|uniref:dicarboxylate/amino acid:cation symporter n=1 Tax=Sphingomonas TaxID=13687 RepID=UPI00092C2D61|nr:MULTISPECIES: dicarboxylate/amino acid:cation symporter [Sphingomonas]MCW6529701.1 dicarboxylate/amino acid:cation symporter [Sphingomonas lycopersici]OJU20054.1 MAG: dicarboxylate/amino acid:cation symporter [Sphingomonas sp. 66-10]
MGKRLTTYIFIALLLGLVVGLALNMAIGDGSAPAQARLEEIAGYFSIVTAIFLRLIKMIIAPLVFSTLVAGIAQMGDTKALGRIGIRSLGWFIGASLLSLGLGLLLVNLFQPGVGVHLTLPAASAATGVETGAFNLKDFISHIFPTSMVDAMAKNEILQIVILSIFVGVAITAVGEKAEPLVRAIDALVHVMLQITDYVMRFAPFAVFAAVAGTLTERGPKVIGQLAYFMGSFYLSLLILWAILLGIGALFIGRRIVDLTRQVREPLLVAFSTASSEAAYPRMLEALERFGVPPRVASFVLPLGYSFNLDGSMIYMGFASLFIAQAYGIHLPIETQITMLLVLMVTSKGIAGVPRASLVVIAATLPMFHIPEAGLLLILAVDHFLDMGRTATNVIGNAVASAVVAKWEGDLPPAGSPGPQ